MKFFSHIVTKLFNNIFAGSRPPGLSAAPIARRQLIEQGYLCESQMVLAAGDDLLTWQLTNLDNDGVTVLVVFREVGYEFVNCETLRRSDLFFRFLFTAHHLAPIGQTDKSEQWQNVADRFVQLSCLLRQADDPRVNLLPSVLVLATTASILKVYLSGAEQLTNQKCIGFAKALPFPIELANETPHQVCALLLQNLESEIHRLNAAI